MSTELDFDSLLEIWLRQVYVTELKTPLSNTAGYFPILIT